MAAELPPLIGPSPSKTDSESLERWRPPRESSPRAVLTIFVGAALRTLSGRVFAGCNVENASFGLTMCAERVAVGAAVAAGQSLFGTHRDRFDGGVTPCGACRQVLAEFGDLDIDCVDANTGHRRTFRLSELLPESFDATRLPGEPRQPPGHANR